MKSAFPLPGEVFVLHLSFHEGEGERLQAEMKKVFLSSRVFSKVLGEALWKAAQLHLCGLHS